MSGGAVSNSPVSSPSAPRMRVFVDFWNLQLTFNEKEAKAKGTPVATERFPIDWLRFPRIITTEAAKLLGTPCAYEGTAIYTSYNKKTDKKFFRWATDWLDRQPGIQVTCSERQPKRPPKCPSCHKPIEACPHCSEPVLGTVEKGVDTAIVTDMIRLAWETAYEVAVLVSSDRDLVPAVVFLEHRGFKVIQAGFPPHGSHLAKKCWASFDLFAHREEFRRKPKTHP